MTFFVASGNEHKVGEIRGLLGPRVVLHSQREVAAGLQPEETGTTFSENAAIKAVAWAQWLAANPPDFKPTHVLADDSGLEVAALQGLPGVHSARFAALDHGRPGNSPDADNSAKLLRLMSATTSEGRQAQFRCVLALTPIHSGSASELHAQTRFFEGTCTGRILASPRGQAGFGYDPLFVPDGETRTFAEMSEAEKGHISHRARALQALARALGIG